ncbi:MAG: fructosamine kinase family protein [Chitinophagaceae bacterium]
MQKPLREFIQQIILQQTGQSSPNLPFKGVEGGSINDSRKITAGDKTLFCKINKADAYPELFAKEANGLTALRSTGCIATPDVIGVYGWKNYQVLLMEWIEQGERTPAFWKKFGEQLAKLHSWKDPAHPQPLFGWNEDNYMGALPQDNTPMDNWCNFFRERRLMPQLELAVDNGKVISGMLQEFSALYDKMEEIFEPGPPCLVHGDLWSGNFLCNESSEPVLIDPAVYYGHAGMDLGMTTLFGGFDPSFYDAYNYWRPLTANHREQWEVCNLYPLLIHLNLFGTSYLSSIASTLRRFQ